MAYIGLISDTHGVFDDKLKKFLEPVDEENENYLAVTDDAVLEAVYAIFKEKFQDVLDFED